ncbi:uncharacterized protein V1518DRAFT_418498 [Limtongia smithiae]|uniref:uncharacterized protein n=1 Tax=Limtongia smithiae TaxID=1125753 RepID=UPI0034D00EE1
MELQGRAAASSSLMDAIRWDTSRASRSARSSSVNGEAGRRCHICLRLFSKSEHLIRHLRSHTKEKPFICRRCGKGFVRRDTLARHAKSFHGVPKEQIDQEISTRQKGSLAPASIDSASEQLSSSVLGEDSTSPDDLQITGSTFESLQELTMPDVDATSAPDSTLVEPLGLTPLSMLLQPSDIDESSDGTPASQQQTRNLQDALNNITSDYASAAFPQVPYSQQSTSSGNSFSLDHTISLIMGDFLVGIDQNAITSNVSNSSGNVSLISTSSSYSRRRKDSRGSVDRVSDRVLSQAIPGQSRRVSAGQGRINIDEQYRTLIKTKLLPTAYSESVPSTDYLNLCLRLYFTHFNPIFPLLHVPTLGSASENSFLLFSMCSIGSLFIGSDNTTGQSTKIFEWLNKTILASWESLISSDVAESQCTVLAAAIGQTFALLSGNPKHLVIAEACHGLVVAWARHGKFVPSCNPVIQLEDLDKSDLNDVWRSWARSEEMNRVVLALYIHDAELARIFNHEPLLRHHSGRLPNVACNELFEARTVDTWTALMREDLMNSSSSSSSPGGSIGFSYVRAIPQDGARLGQFSAYCILEGISAAVCERRTSNRLDGPTTDTFVADLMQWYCNFAQQQRYGEGHDQFCLMVLWHSVHITLFTDDDLLVATATRHVTEINTASLAISRAWAATPNAKRCVYHAALMQKQLHDFQFGAEPGIHVPRCLFQAAVIWYCYMHFGHDESSRDAHSAFADCGEGSNEERKQDDDENMLNEGQDFPELEILDTDSTEILMLIEAAYGFQYDSPRLAEAGMLNGFINLMRRIGHWEIGKTLASTLAALLESGEGL